MFASLAVAVALAVQAAQGGGPGEPNPYRCVEDESEVRYDHDTVVCLHVEGDGWRVLEFPPAEPARPVPWEGLAISG